MGIWSPWKNYCLWKLEMGLCPSKVFQKHWDRPSAVSCFHMSRSCRMRSECLHNSRTPRTVPPGFAKIQVRKGLQFFWAIFGKWMSCQSEIMSSHVWRTAVDLSSLSPQGRILTWQNEPLPCRAWGRCLQPVVGCRSVSIITSGNTEKILWIHCHFQISEESCFSTSVNRFW